MFNDTPAQTFSEENLECSYQNIPVFSGEDLTTLAERSWWYMRCRVDPPRRTQFSYWIFPVQPVLHDLYIKGHGMCCLFVIWEHVFKRFLATKTKGKICPNV